MNPLTSPTLVPPPSLIWFLFPLHFLLSLALYFLPYLPLIITQFYFLFLCSVLKSQSSAPPRHVWLYNQADFDRANSILSSIPWSEILPPCPDTSWTIFKELFLRTMHICIPSKISYPSSLPPHPWLNNKALSLIKRRNSIFRAAKRSGSSSLLSLYHSARNKVVSYLRKLKINPTF